MECITKLRLQNIAVHGCYSGYAAVLNTHRPRPRAAAELAAARLHRRGSIRELRAVEGMGPQPRDKVTEDSSLVARSWTEDVESVGRSHLQSPQRKGDAPHASSMLEEEHHAQT